MIPGFLHYITAFEAVTDSAEAANSYATNIYGDSDSGFDRRRDRWGEVPRNRQQRVVYHHLDR
jgi:hypothetical protein